jgi:hypothetical protein
MSAKSGDACELLITLVHGTWGRGFLFLRDEGRWYADGSRFNTRLADALLKQGLTTKVAPFLWSGANSVVERDIAARQLSEDIRANQSEHRSSINVLIAHSHGGNVALRALDHLGAASDEVFVVTLATPFVEILPAKLSKMESNLIRLVGMVSAIAVVTLVHIVNSAFFKLTGIAATIGSIILGLLAIVFVAWSMRFETADAVKSMEFVKLTETSNYVSRHPILVLRAVDDEAALALAAGALGNRLTRWITERVLFLFYVVNPLIMTSAVLYFSNSPFLPYLAPMCLALISILFVLFLAPGICKSVYGKELVSYSRSCEISSHSAPDMPSNAGAVVTLYQTKEAQKALRHGLYDDPNCANVIAIWLKSQLAYRDDQLALRDELRKLKKTVAELTLAQNGNGGIASSR